MKVWQNEQGRIVVKEENGIQVEIKFIDAPLNGFCTGCYFWRGEIDDIDYDVCLVEECCLDYDQKELCCGKKLRQIAVVDKFVDNHSRYQFFKGCNDEYYLFDIIEQDSTKLFLVAKDRLCGGGDLCDACYFGKRNEYGEGRSCLADVKTPWRDKCGKKKDGHYFFVASDVYDAKKTVNDEYPKKEKRLTRSIGSVVNVSGYVSRTFEICEAEDERLWRDCNNCWFAMNCDNILRCTILPDERKQLGECSYILRSDDKPCYFKRINGLDGRCFPSADKNKR